jgi:hypothetical protein
MQPPSVLWPLPWWTAIVAVIFTMGIPWLVARVRVGRRNRQLRGLAIHLRDSGLALEADAFSVGEGKNVLVVDRDRLAVADLKSWRIVQALPFEEATSLKIYDHRSNQIEFRVVMHGGAQTRKINTRSISGFGRLFILFGRAGKPVEYIQR